MHKSLDLLITELGKKELLLPEKIISIEMTQQPVVDFHHILESNTP